MKKSSNKKGFTLAEILITLGIIGIIAAITIPTLYKKINTKILESRFKKTDAIISQAMKMSSEELGIDAFEETFNKLPDEERVATIEKLDEIWEKQFKGATKYYIKDTVNNKGNWGNWGSLRIYTHSNGSFCGNYYYSMVDSMYGTNQYALILPDGSMIGSPMVMGSLTSATAVTIFFDTNGPMAGPNRVGYDIFKYFSNPKHFANGCDPLSGNTYGSRGDGCYKFAHKNQNPYDKNKTWWSSLYKSKTWWENLKSNSGK